MTRLLSQITDRPQLTTLYQAAAHWQTNDNNNNTLFRAIQEVQRCNCTSLIISCAGQNVFAPFFSSSSGWIGKTLTVNKNNNMFAVNDYQDGSTAFPGTIYVAPFLSAIGSPFHVLFGLDVSTLFSWPFVFDVSYDEHPSVILDYRAKNVFVPVVDGLRPVSHHSLAAAGLEVDETVDDLWIGCMAYTLFGVLNLFSHYFVLEFLPATQTLS